MSSRILIAAALGAAALAACARGGTVPTVPPRVASAEIERILTASAEAWNRGDLDGFVLPYANSPETTFVGASGVRRGFDALRAGYVDSYFKHGAPPQRLGFEKLEVRMLGDSHALMLGEYVLSDRTSGEEVDRGIFSLTWALTEAGWRIMNDHTSSYGR